MKGSTKFLIAAVIFLAIAFFAALPAIVMPMPEVSVPPEPWRPIAFGIGAAAAFFCAGTSLILNMREDCEEKVKAAKEEALKGT